MELPLRRSLKPALILGASLCCLGRTPGPEEFLRGQMRLSPSQMADTQKGKAVTKIISSPNPSDIFVFGTVNIHAKPVAYLQLMKDIGRLNKLTGYLGAAEFSTPPAIGDMDGLSLDDDVEDLKNCRPGNCELQLPEDPWMPHGIPSSGRVYMLAIKQLYATYYFQTALDLSFCVQGPSTSEDEGFYLIPVKASRQAGLTGLRGGVIRKAAVSKTRSSLERALNSIKNSLEPPIELRPKQGNH